MAAIILEGPDGSGKTSLAYALMGSMTPGRGQYIKSPLGKDPKWDTKYNYWHQAMVARYPDQLVILDRTPEISEAVYGPILRSRTRLYNPMLSLQSLSAPATKVIMCIGSPDLEGEHTDSHGNDVVQHHIQVIGGYTLVNDLLTRSAPGRIWIWDKEDMNWEDYFPTIVDHYLPYFPPYEHMDFWKAYEIGKEWVSAES